MEDKNSPNKGFVCKLKVRDPRVIRYFQKNCSATRFCYNYARNVNAEEYLKWNEVKKQKREELSSKIEDPEKLEAAMTAFCRENKKNYISLHTQIRKDITARKNAGEEKFKWLDEVHAMAYIGAVYFDYKKAMSGFNDNYKKNKKDVEKKKAKYIAEGRADKAAKLKYPFAYGFPKTKKYGEVNSFHLDNIQINQVNYEYNRIFIPGLPKWMKTQYGVKHDGYVKVWNGRKIPEFPAGVTQLSNPVISTDGIDWYLSVSYYEEPSYIINDNKVLGVDFGLKELMVTSDDIRIRNFANDSKYARMDWRLRYLQRALSKNKETSPKTKDLPAKERWKEENKTCKAKRLELSIKKLQIKIKQYLDNNRKLAVSQILKDKPSVVVLENLNVLGMFQNGKVAGKLQETAIGKVRTHLVQVAKRMGIEVLEVDRFFPSSQLCSNCGHKVPEMKDLRKRVFICPECGLHMDRDLNAAINLKKAVKEAKPVKLKKKADEEDNEDV